MTFSVSAREASGDPLPDASFTGELVKPNGQRVPLVIPESGADRIVSIVGTELDQSGLFAIEVKAASAGRDVGSARVEFVVFDADSEKTQPAANPEQLAKMAFATEAHGGQLLEPDRLSEQIQRLLDEPVDLTIEYPQRRLLGDTLWDGMLYMLGVVGLLGSEWFFRKRWGLV